MTSTLSAISTVTAPSFFGVWLHEYTDPEGTEAHFLYGNIGRAEKITVDRTLVQYIGRTRPVAEHGESEDVNLSLAITIPWDEDHDAAVEWWRDRVRARVTMLYRDGRGRRYYVDPGALTITDVREGTIVSIPVDAVDFDEEV